MKVLAILSLCAFVAVQGRSADVSNSRAVAALGENPWILHLRIAVSTSGLLNTCAGSLIGARWALTAATCVSDARFIWIRYGVVNVIKPSLVTENSLTISHSDANLALININRNVQPTDNIAPASLVSVPIPETTNFCAFGDDGSDGPGETLSCFEVSLTSSDGQITATSDDGAATEYDIGAPLVSDGVQFAIYTGSDEFLDITDYLSWIEEQTATSEA